jgi:hypothetical protein
MESTVWVELTDHPALINDCSVAFWPTLGRSKTDGMPRAVNDFRSPTPECISIFGVPTDPAERIISLVALAVNKDLP